MKDATSEANGRPFLAELKAIEEFTAALRSGKRVSVPAFLKRYPERAASLGPTLEGTVVLEREFRRLRRKYPNLSLPVFYRPAKKRQS